MESPQMTGSEVITVLMVDDDEDWLQVMSLFLQKRGVRVATCYNGEGLFRKIASVHPDIVLMDIHMREADGESFCRKLKSDRDTAKILLLLFSSDSEIDMVAGKCGADGFIPKTVPPAEIKDILTHRLAAYRA